VAATHVPRQRREARPLRSCSSSSGA